MVLKNAMHLPAYAPMQHLASAISCERDKKFPAMRHPVAAMARKSFNGKQDWLKNRVCFIACYCRKTAHTFAQHALDGQSITIARQTKWRILAMEAPRSPGHPATQSADRSLLIVDSDQMFLSRLAKTMETRGFEVTTSDTASRAAKVIEISPPAFAVIDMRLKDGNGIDLIESLRRRRPEMRAIVLTGHANIATAVMAIKRGADDYLSKPSEPGEIQAALMGTGALLPIPDHPMSADRVRWEHIQRVFEACARNVSETARRLGMHRRTLQRILAKRAPR
jgi:two-component system, response regulator RegA